MFMLYITLLQIAVFCLVKAWMIHDARPETKEEFEATKRMLQKYLDTDGVFGELETDNKELAVYCHDFEKRFVVESLNILNERCKSSYDKDDLDEDGDLCIHDEIEWSELKRQMKKIIKV